MPRDLLLDPHGWMDMMDEDIESEPRHAEHVLEADIMCHMMSDGYMKFRILESQNLSIYSISCYRFHLRIRHSATRGSSCSIINQVDPL